MPRRREASPTPFAYKDGTTPEIPDPSLWSSDPYLDDHLEKGFQPPLVASPPPYLLPVEENSSPSASYVFPHPVRIMRLGAKRGDYPMSPINWLTRHEVPKYWSCWYEQQVKIVSNMKSLHDASILHAVSQTTHNGPKRDKVSLNLLMGRWSEETHTFLAGWGEFAPSLEDVTCLLHLPLFGTFDIAQITLSLEEQETVKHLVECLRLCHQGSASKRANYSLWISYFYGAGVEGAYAPGPANKSGYSFVAFLAMWLDVYVFPGPPFWGVSRRVFPLAVRLAQGKSYPLASAYLGTLYKRMDLLGGHVRRSYARCEVGCYADANFLQLFLYEHFPNYAGDINENIKQGYRSWTYEGSRNKRMLRTIIDK